MYHAISSSANVLIKTYGPHCISMSWGPTNRVLFL